MDKADYRGHVLQRHRKLPVDPFWARRQLGVISGMSLCLRPKKGFETANIFSNPVSPPDEYCALVMAGF